MKRAPFLLGIAIATAVVGFLLVLIFHDGRPQFLSKSGSKIELQTSSYYALAGSNDTFLMREWQVWPKDEEDLFAGAKHEFAKSHGWAQLEGKLDGTSWLQLSSTTGTLTVLFEQGSWRVYEARKVSKLEYYKAWLRSGGKVKLAGQNIKIGRASPKAGSPSKSP